MISYPSSIRFSCPDLATLRCQSNVNLRRERDIKYQHLISQRTNSRPALALFANTTSQTSPLYPSNLSNRSAGLQTKNHNEHSPHPPSPAPPPRILRTQIPLLLPSTHQHPLFPSSHFLPHFLFPPSPLTPLLSPLLLLLLLPATTTPSHLAFSLLLPPGHEARAAKTTVSTPTTTNTPPLHMALPSLPHPLAAGRHEAVFEGWTCFVFFFLFRRLRRRYLETEDERQG